MTNGILMLNSQKSSNKTGENRIIFKNGKIKELPLTIK